MIEQLHLGFRSSSSQADKADLARFYVLLETHPAWITAKQLSTITGWDDRFLRLLAHSSNGNVISGNKGYRLTRLATPDEILGCTAQLRHQAGSMEDRAAQIDRVYHESIRS